MLKTSRERSVKIVATLGPASDSAKTIRELFIAGADVFRLNLSHGNHSELKERYQIIRELEKELGRPIGILADLQGPKLRCGDFENGDEELVEPVGPEERRVTPGVSGLTADAARHVVGNRQHTKSPAVNSVLRNV